LMSTVTPSSVMRGGPRKLSSKWCMKLTLLYAVQLTFSRIPQKCSFETLFETPPATLLRLPIRIMRV
jgi:hypothetical protein